MAEMQAVRRAVCVDADQARDADGALLLPELPNWGGVPVRWNSIPAEEVRGPTYCDAPTVLVATEGTGRRWYRTGLRELALHTAPRMIELYSQGYEVDRMQWQGSEGRCIALQFTADLLEPLLHEAAPGFTLQTHHELFDERIAGLAFLLFEEARQGAPAGRLYAEGLTLALLGCLQQAYAAPKPEASSRRAVVLSALQRQRVVALIDGHLGQDLSVSRLAGEVALSPFHFARAFKGSFGITPHRFVQQRRIDRAMQWLTQQPSKPIVEIALDLGFASQAHFTEAFRRATGMTPARLRRQ